ncbi:DUF3100 domain-containing protein [Cellulomonas denverensis]|nr:DUF3100 domain-containing protein [Cellulomonas denverensis]GIG25394.1 hypothetical protein Cde04nite_16380 [Cellulomonas denverensis]
MTSLVHDPAPTALRYTWRSPRLWVVVTLMIVIAGTAQFLGKWTISVGSFADIAVLPLVFGLLIGGAISAQPWRRFPLDLQSTASTVMGVAVLLLIARLSFTMGPNIRMLFNAGPALLLQEVGHLFGTLALALPLAVLLRMGPATVGATFSIDREGAFAMVSERYGPDSPQYRGVLSMYAFGTLFGAIVITVVASVMSALNVFDPRALAMGSGVGSGSMMAAASGAVATAHPELADDVLALAATSNVITSLLGVYVGMYVALPLAEKYYQLLTRRQQLRAPAATAPAPAVVTAPPVGIATWTVLTVLVLAGFLVNAVAPRSLALHLDWRALAGFLVLAALVAIGLSLSRLTRGKVGAMFLVITLGALISTPWSPIQEPLLDLVNRVDFLGVCTLVLSTAGLSLGKDLPMLKAIGWKIIPVGLVSITSAYLLASTVAQLALTIWN